jgi:diguanylate cyclase (GGDEF)-like protein
MSTSPEPLPADNSLHNLEDIGALVTANSPSSLCFFPGREIISTSLDKTTLIITSTDFVLLPELFANPDLPSHTPILILHTQQKTIPEIFRSNSERLIDHHFLPTPASQLQLRLDFLEKVSDLSSDRNVHITTHSRQLESIFKHDSLTGLLNRRQFTRHLSEEMERAAKTTSDLTLLIFNIDLFNDINKRYGLDFGDFILNELGARLTETIERPGRCFRHSSEDFSTLLPGYDAKSAHAVTKKLLDICSNKPFCDAGNSISITISIGMASLTHHRPDDFEKFIFMAESALFTAKASGRNQARSYLDRVTTSASEQPNPLSFLKEKLGKILDKTRLSAISSLQHLAKSIAGPEHKQHVAQVSSYTSLLSEQMRLPKQLQETFQNSITLYTSFRFLLHNDLLTKPGALTRDEWKVIEDLPFKIRELTDMFDYFSEERELLVCQSENYDGSGYPEGLKGNEIPIGARILKIVDSLAAMTGERPYRRKLSHEEIIRELYQGAGKQFDPFLVLQIFLVIEKNRLLDVSPEYLSKAQRDLNSKVQDLLI